MGLVVRYPIGCSTKVTVPAWRLDRRRSVLMGSTNFPLFGSFSARIRCRAHDPVLRGRGREDVRRKSQYREPMQLGLDLGRRIPQNPLGANPKGLIQALADLLLEAVGVETNQMPGGDHEYQDHA